MRGKNPSIHNCCGNAAAEYTYDAWGNPLSITGTLASTIGQLNPFRYRGYVWDSETGLFYVNSRYYNPETSRYINGDDRLNTSQGFLGTNQFAYCLNNPVMLYDPDGHTSLPPNPFKKITKNITKSITKNADGSLNIKVPERVFDSIDTAAEDFLRSYNRLSIIMDLELGTAIYKTKRGFAYNTVVIGNNNSVKPQYGAPKGKKMLAGVHTHAAYDLAYNSDQFSRVSPLDPYRGTDELWVWYNNVPLYLGTPLGTMRIMTSDEINGTIDILMFSDLPFDPNHPDRK